MGSCDIGALLAEAQGAPSSLVSPRLCECGAAIIERHGRGTRGPKRKRCDACQVAFKRSRDRVRHRRSLSQVIGSASCVVCGKTFSIKKANPDTVCCSTKCGHTLATPRIHATRSANARARRTANCKHCGKSFVKWTSGTGEYCSNKCRGAAHRIHATRAEAKRAEKARRNERLGVIAKPRREVVCLRCSKAFSTTDPHKTYCSTSCSKTASNRAARPCIQCGNAFYPVHGGNRCCSKKCRDKHKRSLPWFRAAKAIGKARRRAMLSLVIIERVDPMDVFARDGWRCQLCGTRTPRKLVGSNDLRAPTLDHTIPLAVGGEHSYRNSQCACRDCNNKKAAKIRGQLRLFG
jgi:hypothetical protein